MKRKEPFFLEYNFCSTWFGNAIAKAQCIRPQAHPGDHGPRLLDDDRRQILWDFMGFRRITSPGDLERLWESCKEYDAKVKT